MSENIALFQAELLFFLIIWPISTKVFYCFLKLFVVYEIFTSKCQCVFPWQRPREKLSQNGVSIMRFCVALRQFCSWDKSCQFSILQSISCRMKQEKPTVRNEFTCKQSFMCETIYVSEIHVKKKKILALLTDSLLFI